MKRKVIKQGPATLMVSLPSKWVKKCGVRKGDEVEISEENNFLSIFPREKRKEIKEKDLQLANADPQFIRLILSNLYRLNFDRLNIGFDTLKDFESIQELSNKHFLGFEVTRKFKKNCVIENVTEPNGEKYDILLRRVFLMIKESLSMIKTDLQSKDHGILSVLQQQFDKTDQFANFCLRTINKNNNENSNLKYLFIYDLLVMMGELRHMYEFIEKNKIQEVSKDIYKFVENIQDIFNKFYDAFYKRDIKLILQVNTESKNLLYTKSYSLLGKVPQKEAGIVYHLTIFLRLITLILSPTTGIILD